MHTTERDLKLVRWANGHGYVSISQIAEFLGVDFRTAARRVRILCRSGLLIRLPFPMSAFSVVAPTRTGCDLASDDLAPVSGVRVPTSRHDLALVDLARSLESSFSMTYESERRLRHRGVTIAGHSPDGLLHPKSGLPVGVELELSAKSPRRLEAIFDRYAACADVDEAWYIVTDPAMRVFIKRVLGERSGIRVKLWKRGGAQTHADDAVTVELRDA